MAAENRHLAIDVWEEWRSGHREKHKSIDRHIDTFHNRMWRISMQLITGMFVIIGALIAFIAVDMLR